MTEKDEAADELSEEEADALLAFMEKSPEAETHTINVDDSVPPEKPSGFSKYPTPVVPSPVVPRRDSPVAVPKHDGPLDRVTPFQGDPDTEILKRASGEIPIEVQTPVDATDRWEDGGACARCGVILDPKHMKCPKCNTKRTLRGEKKKEPAADPFENLFEEFRVPSPSPVPAISSVPLPDEPPPPPPTSSDAPRVPSKEKLLHPPPVPKDTPRSPPPRKSPSGAYRHASPLSPAEKAAKDRRKRDKR